MMTRRLAAALATGVLAVLAAGCASNPLVGQWSAMDNAGGVSLNTTLTFNANGTVDLTLMGTGSCSGSQMHTGGTWSSDGANVTFGGTPACSGEVQCMVSGVNVTIGCSSGMGMGVPMGAVAYSLSNNNMTLMLGARTYTRSN